MSKNKVKIIPCSGMGKAFGLIARESTLQAIKKCPEEVETVCLAYVVTGDEEAKKLVEKQEAFKILLKEYLESQKTIKNKFRADFSQENLSDAEAKKILNQSFDLGQQLLNNRKVYADKFLKILTPQQVLKLFNQEGRMREKFMERRQKMGPPKGREPMPNP